MISNTAKDFNPIRNDYAFFENHSTEAAEDVRTYMPYVQPLASTGRPIHMLDFGCGDGKFSAQFHTRAQFPQEKLHLTLVEPVAIYRQQAQARLQKFSTDTLKVWAELPSDLAAQFDLVLANHVLYYVPNLEHTLTTLMQKLTHNGCFLTAFAGQSNTLVQFWNTCFALLGKSLPYHTANNFETVLKQRHINYQKEEVYYHLEFLDTEENRLRIVHFLMGNYFPEIPRQAMLALFSPYSKDEKVSIRIMHEHFIIRK